jgi:hypothetical protein
MPWAAVAADLRNRVASRCGSRPKPLLPYEVLTWAYVTSPCLRTPLAHRFRRGWPTGLQRVLAPANALPPGDCAAVAREV